MFLSMRYFPALCDASHNARVSTLDQNLDRQLDSLVSYGVDIRNIYKEKLSGKTKDRPELIKMIDELQPEDIVVVADITRIIRSTKDLLEIVEQIKEKGASIKSLKDSWLDTTSSNPYNEFLLTGVPAVFYENFTLSRKASFINTFKCGNIRYKPFYNTQNR